MFSRLIGGSRRRYSDGEWVYNFRTGLGQLRFIITRRYDGVVVWVLNIESNYLCVKVAVARNSPVSPILLLLKIRLEYSDIHVNSSPNFATSAT